MLKALGARREQKTERLEMDRTFLVLAAVFGFLAVALGAFGAHGLERMLAEAEDGARRMQWWTTAAHYHLTHAIALGLVAWAASRSPSTCLLYTSDAADE